ncbi:hypothetical protein KAT92_05505 [Candidatus Babeliales bacterium]|nr:hypothetical protein [Candidatus Babeliales bacterium]
MKTEFDIDDVVVYKTQVLAYAMAERRDVPAEQTVSGIKVKSEGTSYYLGGSLVAPEDRIILRAEASEWVLNYIATRVGEFKNSKFYHN